jgi:hypothetical protein
MSAGKRAYLQFRVVYVLLALNFIIPAISYAVRPEVTMHTLDAINVALGGRASGVDALVGGGARVWHMLAVGNVMTLGFMCALMAYDLRRFYPVLPALAFLKGFSALYSLYIGAVEHVPVFYAVFLLDGLTTAAMIFFARRARAYA